LIAEDARYLKAVLDPIKVCAHYKPKFGQGAKGGGLTLAQFQTLYQSDPFYSWFGLDNPLMYAAHKAAGGMTSVYRQIGIGCEKLDLSPFLAQKVKTQNSSNGEFESWGYRAGSSRKSSRLPRCGS
jgi:hypothetical protein